MNRRSFLASLAALVPALTFLCRRKPEPPPTLAEQITAIGAEADRLKLAAVQGHPIDPHCPDPAAPSSEVSYLFHDSHGSCSWCYGRIVGVERHAGPAPFMANRLQLTDSVL